MDKMIILSISQE